MGINTNKQTPLNRRYSAQNQSSTYDPYGPPLNEDCYYDADEMIEAVASPYDDNDDYMDLFDNHLLDDSSPYDPRKAKRLPGGAPFTISAAKPQKLPAIPSTANQQVPSMPTARPQVPQMSNGHHFSAVGCPPTKPHQSTYKNYQPPVSYGPLSTPAVPATTSNATSSAPQQMLAGGITTFTKTISSIFASKTPAAPTSTAPRPFGANNTTTATQAATTNGGIGLSFAAKFMQPKQPPPPTTTSTSTTASTTTNIAQPPPPGVSNNCDEEYYTSIGRGPQPGSNANPTQTTHKGGVDYSDDYKYNYDDFSYSETDYIATGDITNVKNHYNNNYPDYGCAAVEPRLIGDPDDDRAFSGGLGQPQHKHHQQQIDNISYSYCNSNGGLHQAATSTAAPHTMRYQATPPQNTVSSMVTSNANSTTVVSSTGSTVAAKSGAMLQKQQPTVVYDDDEDELLEEDEYEDTYMAGGDEDEDELDDAKYVVYMEDHVSIAATVASSSAAGDYYTTPATTLATAGNVTAAPYYNYQEDYFNEEDEYKYLAEEQKEYHHDGSEFYHEDPDPAYYPKTSVQNGFHGAVDDALISSSGGVASPKSQPPPVTQVTKKKHLAAQDSIDDNEFFMKHSTNQLTINTNTALLSTMQHDTIREEEDECQTPLGGSAGDYAYPQHPASAVTSPAKVLSPVVVASPKSVASPLQLHPSATAAPSLLLATTTATTSSSIIGGITASTAAAAMAAATSTMNHIADIGGGGALAAEAAHDEQAATNTTNNNQQLAAAASHLPLPMMLLEPGSAAGVAALLDPSAMVGAPEKKKIGLGMAIGEMGMTVAGTTGMVGRKSEITAKQRWNWAYNKIIMQLNVSRDTICILFFFIRV